MIRVREMDIEFCRNYTNNLEASRRPGWQYNEMKPCGVNYNNTILARLYDTTHRLFRECRQEVEEIVARLGLDASAAVIDMRCGTGAFALYAAEQYRTVQAVDVSAAMLGRGP